MHVTTDIVKGLPSISNVKVTGIGIILLICLFFHQFNDNEVHGGLVLDN